MESKIKTGFSLMLKIMLIPLIFIFFQSAPANADTGDLKINNQVIYEKSDGNQNNVANFTINQLFMQDMSERDQQLKEEQTKLVTQAQNEVFVQETSKGQNLQQQVTPTLFTTGYALNESLDSNSSKAKKAGNLGFILFCLVGGTAVVGIGILLGRAFPRWLKRS